MSRRNTTRKARCLLDFDHVTPASVLEIRTCVTSPLPDSIIETPEFTTHYKAGQVVELSSASALKAFMKFHAGKFEVLP